MSTNVNDLTYRPLQSRLHEILDEHDLVSTALSDVDITAIIKGHPVPNYGPTLQHLLDLWQLLKRRLEHDSNSATCREIGMGITKLMRPEHVVRVVRAYVEFAPRDSLADLEVLIGFVERLMAADGTEKNLRQEKRESSAGSSVCGSQVDEDSLHVNKSELRRVVSLLYHGVKAAKAVGGPSSKTRSAVVDSADPVSASSSTGPPSNVPPSATSRISTMATGPVRHPRTPTKYKPQTYERDGKRCLITSAKLNGKHLQIAHIIPYSVLNTDSSFEHNPFWKLLRSWLGEHRSTKVWSAVGREAARGGRLLINLMCVTALIHSLWGTGEGVIVPELLPDEVVRGEEGNPDMRFLMPVRWVRVDGTRGVERSTTTRNMATSATTLNVIPATSKDAGGGIDETDSDPDSDPEVDPPIHSIPYHPPTNLHQVLKVSRTANYFRKETSIEYRPLKSNEIIVLYNYMRDNEKYPLPHPDLLRLWGAISRLVRMSGMGELVDLEREEEEDQMEQRLCNGWAGWDDVESASGMEYCTKRLSELVAWGWNERDEDRGGTSDAERTCSCHAVSSQGLSGIAGKPDQCCETNTGCSIPKITDQRPDPIDPVPTDKSSPFSIPGLTSPCIDTDQENAQQESSIENSTKTRFITVTKTGGISRSGASTKRRSTPGTLSGRASRPKRVRYK